MSIANTALAPGDRVQIKFKTYAGETFATFHDADGNDCLLELDSGEVEIVNRNGLEFVPTPERIAEMCKHFRETHHDLGLSDSRYSWRPSVREYESERSSRACVYK